MEQSPDIEKCHYCGKEFTAESLMLARHLREETEVLAELPAVLGNANGIGSVDIHEGKLYTTRVRPGACMDDVRTEPVSRERARMMILTEINYHDQIVQRLAESQDAVFAKIEAAEQLVSR